MRLQTLLIVDGPLFAETGPVFASGTLATRWEERDTPNFDEDAAIDMVTSISFFITFAVFAVRVGVIAVIFFVVVKPFSPFLITLFF